MAGEIMALSQMLEKGADADVLRELTGFAQRNGDRDRYWEPRAVTAELRIPRLGKHCYFPGVLAPRRMADKALTAMISRALTRIRRRRQRPVVLALAGLGVAILSLAPTERAVP